ncbi:MAG TPA: HAD-IA family hydrolase [Acidimicrobiales bacterium]|nr:HAD-IA family hydrolase [Acidimicrobiales bacterium]
MSELQAVVFDVDGTLVDSERHGHRVAFNRAFEKFELPHRWDEDTYGELLRVTGGQRRLHHYLEGQGMDGDERERLVPELHARKSEIFKELVEEGRLDLRPGAARLLSEIQEAGASLGVVTTGSGHWVEALLGRVAASVDFDVMVFGDDVEERKPDPEAYEVALDRLGLGPAQAVAVEDSAEGLQSALSAGLRCVVVVNGYTAEHDLSGADLVLDGFGDDDTPAQVVVDSHGTGCDGVVRLETLQKLVGAG